MRRYFVTWVKGRERSGLQSWCLDGDEAFRVGVPNPRLTTNAHFTVDPGRSFEEAFFQAFPFWQGSGIVEKVLGPGQYYPRMVRPIDSHPFDKPGRFPTHSLYDSEIAGTVGQLTSLVGRIMSICQVVEPTQTNLSVYGHEIRECLVIAAMEVESHWKAILRVNGSSGSSTKEYIRTLAAMRLNEYAITFSRYPGLNAVSPFSGWTASHPTKSLPFYDAYNAVKHDRETEFRQGSLEQALMAVAACAVLATAQFGWTDIFVRNRGLIEFFGLANTPEWDASELYTMEADGWKSGAAPYPF